MELKTDAVAFPAIEFELAQKIELDIVGLRLDKLFM